GQAIIDRKTVLKQLQEHRLRIRHGGYHIADIPWSGNGHLIPKTAGAPAVISNSNQRRQLNWDMFQSPKENRHPCSAADDNNLRGLLGITGTDSAPSASGMHAIFPHRDCSFLLSISR